MRNVLAPRFSCTFMNGKTKQEVGYSSQHLTFKALTYLPRKNKYSRAFTPSFKKVSFFSDGHLFFSQFPITTINIVRTHINHKYIFCILHSFHFQTVHFSLPGISHKRFFLLWGLMANLAKVLMNMLSYSCLLKFSPT